MLNGITTMTRIRRRKGLAFQQVKYVSMVAAFRHLKSKVTDENLVEGIFKGPQIRSIYFFLRE